MPADPRWLSPEAAARYLSVRADALGRLVRMVLRGHFDGIYEPMIGTGGASDA